MRGRAGGPSGGGRGLIWPYLDAIGLIGPYLDAIGPIGTQRGASGPAWGARRGRGAPAADGQGLPGGSLAGCAGRGGGGGGGGARDTAGEGRDGHVRAQEARGRPAGYRRLSRHAAPSTRAVRRQDRVRGVASRALPGIAGVAGVAGIGESG